MAQYMLEKQVIKHSKGLWLLPYMLVRTVVSIQFAIDVHIFYIDFLFMYDINPQSQRKCCVHCSIVMWNVSAHRWLHKQIGSIKGSISRPCDLTWFHLSLSVRENCFFYSLFFLSSVINIDAAISIITHYKLL